MRGRTDAHAASAGGRPRSSPRDALAFQHRPVSLLLERRTAGGELFPVTTLPAGAMWVVGTPELAREVLHGDPDVFRAGAANERILPVLPPGTLLTLDGAEHRDRRSLLAPLFRGESLERLVPAIRQITDRELERWPIDRPFRLLPRLRTLTLTIAARLLLGVDAHADIVRIERHIAPLLAPSAMLRRTDALRALGPLSPQARRARRGAAFAGLLAELRRTRPRQCDGADAIDLLVEAGRDQIAPEILALLLAGQETTASALAWSVHGLLSRPPVHVAADTPELDALIHETLRLHPPLVDIVRELAQPASIGSQPMQRGDMVLVPPVLIHRDRADPTTHRFDTRRFLGRRPDPDGWIPFGGGHRRCLGAALAMLELREILPRITTSLELHPVTGAPERPQLHGTALVPAHGIEVLAHRRRT